MVSWERQLSVLELSVEPCLLPFSFLVIITRICEGGLRARSDAAGWGGSSAGGARWSDGSATGDGRRATARDAGRRGEGRGSRVDELSELHRSLGLAEVSIMRSGKVERRRGRRRGSRGAEVVMVLRGGQTVGGRIEAAGKRRAAVS